jgi:endonuclease/exonuclease/phosphatase family metal-dependent hydrolase
VLTNSEVKNFEKIRLFNRNAIKTEVVFEGKLVDIFSIYLDDMSEDIRLEQIKSLFKLINKNKPTIFMGDLNTMDIDDKAVLPNLGIELKNILKDMSRGEVIKFIKNNGFIDANIDRLKTVPTKLFPIKIDKAILRLDYIFYSQNLKLRNFEVLIGEIFDKTSDHFPIEAEF